MPSALRPCQLLAALALLGAVAGCAQLDLRQPIARVFGADDKPQAPAKVVAIWTDAVIQPPDRPAARGFGGRLTFYAPDRDPPVCVDGSLTVYAYEEQDLDGKDTRPDRKYVFTPEQFAKHYGKSKLGPSYSVWIPWDEAGGARKRIALICRFQPVDGRPVVSEQTVLTLPGEAEPVAASGSKRGDQAGSVGARTSQVRPVAHYAPIPEGPAEGQAELAGNRRTKITTIPITPQFGRVVPLAQTGHRVDVSGGEDRQPPQIAQGRPNMPTPDGAATAPSASPPDSPPARPRSTDCRSDGSPAPGGQAARPAGDRRPWPRRLEGSQFRSQSTLPPASGSEPNSISPAGPPISTPVGRVEQAWAGER